MLLYSIYSGVQLKRLHEKCKTEIITAGLALRCLIEQHNKAIITTDHMVPSLEEIVKHVEEKV